LGDADIADIVALGMGAHRFHADHVAATWEITITRREGSRLRFSEQRGSAPQKGKIVEMADAGTSIKARIDTYSEERFKASGLDYFQVMATET
jgi:hypothetical protein